MSDLPEKTITAIGRAKQALRFVDSISHATYIYEGQQGTLPLFSAEVEGDIIRLYVHFDTSFTGPISGVCLVDKDGDVVVASEKTYEKPPDKGFYVAFKYRIIEEAVDSVESL